MANVKNVGTSGILFCRPFSSHDKNYPPYPPDYYTAIAPGKEWNFGNADSFANLPYTYLELFRDINPRFSKGFSIPGAAQKFFNGRIRNNDTVEANPDTGISPTIIGMDNNMLDTFDHVVVLMLENRSFDNLLGYMYPNGIPNADKAPRGQTFEGVSGKELSNQVPPGDDRPNRNRISVSPVGKDPLNPDIYNYFQPYPDPGEDYVHVNTQLYSCISRPNDGTLNNLPSAPPPATPGMDGFITDYIENFKNVEEKGKIPSYAEYSQIMQCYPTEAVPVLTTLAENFGVFDHWFCAVPSQTWCNRAFWNAGTSWGWVVNPKLNPVDLEIERWNIDNFGDTIFNQIEKSGNKSISWKVYGDGYAPSLTFIVHLTALTEYYLDDPLFDTRRFFYLTDFYNDCANNKLPSYSFLEPQFLSPNNDMHPNSAVETGFKKGPVGSVLLGEKLVYDVYEAIRKMPKAQRDKTLLIITFDEHGGCYDHVPPPGNTEDVTPPDLKGYTLQNGFDFTRLGIRVPTIMVSSHIAMNTVVKTPMNHCSFMKTMGTKWDKGSPERKFPPLTDRVRDSFEFTEVFTLTTPRTDWPNDDPNNIQINEPVIPQEQSKRDFSNDPISLLGRTILEASSVIPKVVAAKKRGEPLPDVSTINTVGDAENYFIKIDEILRKPEVPK